MSLRAPPEHHQLIRDIATTLRTRPELADVLRSQHDGVTERDTDVLQSFQERLMIHSDALQRVMAYADNINERLKALEQRAPSETVPPAPASTRATPRPIPLEHVEEAARLWDSGKGPTFRQIVTTKEWPHDHKALNKAVRRYLRRDTDFPST
jgi:hypothetical protein